MDIVTTIIQQLVQNEAYMRKVIPYLKAEYFTDNSDRFLFHVIDKFVATYNKPPTAAVLRIALDQTSKLNEHETQAAQDKVEWIAANADDDHDFDWLVDTTEEFCKEQALFGALLEAIQIKDGQSKKDVHAIPELLTDALGVSFDADIGHDYLEDYEKRFDFYHNVQERVPFHLDMFNKITGGGVPKKTLNVILAGVGVGKSLFMCDWAANLLPMGFNVGYITMEMAEEKISERIDANSMDRTIDEVLELPKIMYIKQMARVRQRAKGRLKIKEYPTASAHAGHFRFLLDEWAVKQAFKPDILFIDYMNICASSRFRMGNSINSYTYIKSIAEELRGLGVEKKLPIVSATQLNREGFSSSDPDMTNVSESFGTPATSDLFFAIQTSEELEQLNQLAVKQIKNRYGDVTKNKRFVIGVNKAKMKLYDVEEKAQTVQDAGASTTTLQVPVATEEGKFDGIMM